MARLIDARGAVELDPMVGGVVVMDFGHELQPRNADAADTDREVRITRGGARLDRSLELLDWFDVIAG